jgi:hypothetical protein
MRRSTVLGLLPFQLVFPDQMYRKTKSNLRSLAEAFLRSGFASAPLLTFDMSRVGFGNPIMDENPSCITRLLNFVPSSLTEVQNKLQGLSLETFSLVSFKNKARA